MLNSNDLPFFPSLTLYVRLCILTTFTIYLRTGLEIFKRRSHLRSFSHGSPSETSVIENPFTNPFSSFKTTEVTITSELIGLPHSNGSQTSLKFDPMGRAMSAQQNYEQYSVTIERGSMSPMFSVPKFSGSKFHPPHRNAAMEANTAAFSYLKCALLFFVSLMITWVSSARSWAHCLRNKSSNMTLGSVLDQSRLFPHPPGSHVFPL